MFEALSDRFDGIFSPHHGQGEAARGGRRRGPPRDPPGPARGRRQLPGRQEPGRPHPRAVVGTEVSRGAEPGPAGRQDRPRGAHRSPSAARPSRSPTPPSRPPSCSWPASRARARPPTRPSSPAGSRPRAATRCWSAPTSSARPPSSSSAPWPARSTSRCSRPTTTIGGVRHGDPVEVAKACIDEARRLGKDVVIVDTAGRLAIDAELMEQVRQISEVDRAPTTRSSSSTP